VERENDYVLIISLDSVNSSAFVEAYTPILSSDSSTLSCIYLSACDFPDTPSSTFYTTTHTPADSTTSSPMTSSSMHLAPYTDLFLSTKKKYKPIAKKVRPVIGELPEKFHIERKIIGNPLNDLPVLNPNPPPFKPSDRYTLERRDQLNKNCKGITQTLIPDTLAVKPKVSQSTDGNLLWSVVYISDTVCLRLGVANDTQPALADPHPLRWPWPVTGGYAAGVP
jgi:hypothetical protein